MWVWARWLGRSVPRPDPSDLDALARLAVLAALATGVVAWAAGMVVLVRVIVGY